MIKITNLTKEDKKKLEEMSREEVGRVAIRALIILWSYKDQQSPEEIAKRIGWKVKRVRKWLKRFLKEGIISLYDLPRKGRKSKVQAAILTAIDMRLSEGHPPEETNHSIWTINLLVGFLSTFFGLTVHPDTVRRWVHNLKFRWRRPKNYPAPSNDPNREDKLARIADAYKNKRPEDHILYQDESTFFLLPIIRSMWTKIGQQFKILTYSGWNACIKVFGALNESTGQWKYQIFSETNSITFIAFLETILATYSQGTIYMITDCARYHTSQQVKDWLSLNTRIQLLYLPTRSPQLNPVEKVWWGAKKKCMQISGLGL